MGCEDMIEFECPHCGNPMRMEGSRAGSDGWCRVCFQMIVVPSSELPRGLLDLDARERFERLWRLFRHVAKLGSNYRKLYHEARSNVESLETAVAQSASTHGAAEVSSLQAELDESQRAREALDDALCSLREETQFLQTAYAAPDPEMEELRSKYDSLEALLRDLEQSRDGKLDGVDLSSERVVPGDVALENRILSLEKALEDQRRMNEALSRELSEATDGLFVGEAFASAAESAHAAPGSTPGPAEIIGGFSKSGNAQAPALWTTGDPARQVSGFFGPFAGLESLRGAGDSAAGPAVGRAGIFGGKKSAEDASLDRMVDALERFVRQNDGPPASGRKGSR